MMKFYGPPRGNPHRIVRVYFWLADRFYHELAWLFDTCTKALTFGWILRCRRLALEHLPVTRVLDVGCGTGDLLLELAANASELFGLDNSIGMQRVMVKKVRRRGLKIPFILGSAHRQPFISDWFHAVVTTFPSGFAIDPEAIDEIARILVPAKLSSTPNSGRLIIVGMCLCSDNSIVNKILCAVYNSSPERMLEDFTLLAKDVGFKVDIFMHKTGIVQVPVMVAEKRG